MIITEENKNELMQDFVAKMITSDIRIRGISYQNDADQRTISCDRFRVSAFLYCLCALGQAIWDQRKT